MWTVCQNHANVPSYIDSYEERIQLQINRHVLQFDVTCIQYSITCILMLICHNIVAVCNINVTTGKETKKTITQNNYKRNYPTTLDLYWDATIRANTYSTCKLIDFSPSKTFHNTLCFQQNGIIRNSILVSATYFNAEVICIQLEVKATLWYSSYCHYKTFHTSFHI